MKLITTSLLGAFAVAQNTTMAPGKTEVPQQMNMMLRASGTNNPVLADFENPQPADLSYGASWGSGGNCGYIRQSGTGQWDQDNYSTNCDGTICCGGQGVPCEWRGTDSSTLPDGAGTYNGWHCNTANTVCFAVIEQNVNWWAALDLCESELGMRLAAPKDQTELELITHNYQFTGRIWTAAFYSTEMGQHYWAHDSTPISSWVRDDTSSSITFEDADFLDQVSQDVPTEILENMLYDHGMDQSSNTAGRKRREAATHTDTISQLIERNGCWCPSTLAGSEHFPGAPLNDYDTACRKLAHCVHNSEYCASGACFSENTNEGFQYAIDVTDLSAGFACRSTNACDTAVCMCQVQFAKDVFELVVAAGDTMTIDDAHLDLATGNAQCVAPTGTGTGAGAAGSC